MVWGESEPVDLDLCLAAGRWKSDYDSAGRAFRRAMLRRSPSSDGGRILVANEISGQKTRFVWSIPPMFLKEHAMKTRL